MTATFDEFVETYEAACERGLSLTGEHRDYFARERVRISARAISGRASVARSILDFGCGLGHTGPLLLDCFPSAIVVGLDNSSQTIARARELRDNHRLQFTTSLDGASQSKFDLAYCNGVFHHIPPLERFAHARLVFDALRPNGMFAFWENNPWNPGTRLVMSRIPFDRDAIPLSVLESRRLLSSAGFQVVQSSFHFFFPSPLRLFRPLEPAIDWLPLGGQYCVLAVKPTN